MIHKNYGLMAFLLGMSLPLLLPGELHAANYVFPDTIGISATRTFQNLEISPADTIVVTVSLSNTEPESLRNLYFSDHTPEDLFDISTVEVVVNGVALPDTEYIYQVGLSDEVYAGAVPHRWAVEVPPDSLGDRSCSNILDPGTGTLQIMYTARCTTSGDHCFPSYTWAGQLTGGETVEIFGYTDSVFLTVADAPPEVDDLTSVLYGSNMFLFWSPPSYPMAIDYYVVYRDTFPGFDSGSGESLGISTDTFYVDDAAAGIGDPGLNWYYLVRAVDLLGKKSGDSNRAGEYDKYLGNLK